MSLIEGKALQERWYDMNEDEKRAICEQLRPGPDKGLKQTSVSSVGCKQTIEGVYFIGSLAKATAERNLFLCIVRDSLDQFQDACRIEIGGEAPIVFTHDDLVSPNILVLPGLDPKVAAVIDWVQAGWYPTYVLGVLQGATGVATSGTLQ